jgi:general secretion pathway protein G
MHQHFKQARAARRRAARQMSGFTMLELMVVLTIIGILLTIAIPIYNQSIQRARERSLRNDIDNLDMLIERYTLDKQKAPQSLDDLKSAGYLPELPKDPMTGDRDWEPVEEEDVVITADQQEGGITAVHSHSAQIGSNGEPYNTW